MTCDFFDKLFVFEMANNHMGSVDHGLRIIREVKAATRCFDFRFAFKFQYRHLDSFIHPAYQGRNDIKYVKRFQETQLAEEGFVRLKEEVVKAGFLCVCTPFDESSVDVVERHGYDVIKVGSCSFTDWPLLERVAKTDKPLIASTAGVSTEDIDKVVAFFEHRRKNFALMHCVGEYPTPNHRMELNQIDFLRSRYPSVPVGFSTHEGPDFLTTVQMAVAKGAKIFEKHVGVSTEQHSLNAYSASPQQVCRWLKAAADAFELCGVSGVRRPFTEKEKEDLRGLRRGVFAARPIREGERVDPANTFFAIPNVPGQLVANDVSKYKEYIAEKDILASQPVLHAEVRVRDIFERATAILRRIQPILLQSRVALPNNLDLELSHHYGIDRYEEWGAAIINCINREYCKKLIILLPGQKHPVHRHVRKEETFHVLCGDLSVGVNGLEKEYLAGEMVVVERNARHGFSSRRGVVFEEISTTHFKDDSYYDDEAIVNNLNRKTQMTFWADWLGKEII